MSGRNDEWRKARDHNRAHWDSITPVHVESGFYNVEGVISGRSKLDEFVTREVGDVRGKSLLHLQCHFGLDTLRWARLGARVTGLDFSELAVSEARRLARMSGLAAEFVIADVLDAGSQFDGKFDIVFTSFGVLCWLGDLGRWANTVSRALRPRGVFHIFEFHPVMDSLDYDRKISRRSLPQIAHSFFDEGRPTVDTGGADYADPTHTSSSVTYEWSHPVSEVMAALRVSGLTVTEFKEYPFTTFMARPGMVRRKDGLWRMPAGAPLLPLTYYLRAVKPG